MYLCPTDARFPDFYSRPCAYISSLPMCNYRFNGRLGIAH